MLECRMPGEGMEEGGTMSEIDVLVVGGGVSGLAAALALLESGRGVRVIEARTIGSGASHGNCGTITPSHAPPLAAPGTVLKALKWALAPDAPLYIPPRYDPLLWRWLLGFSRRCNPRDWEASARGKHALLADSRQRLGDWVARFGLDCEFVESGEDYVFRDPRAFAHGQREIPLLRELGVAVELVDGKRLEAEEPALKPGVAGALRFAGDAALRPDRYLSELVRAIRERGGEVVEHCALHGLREDREGVIAYTDHDAIRARNIVLALGAWSATTADAVGLPWMKRIIQPGKGYSITYSAPALVPKRPLVLRERSVCVTAWGSGYRLGSTMEFSGFDDTLNARRLAALERGAREYLHEPVGTEVREQWYGWRPMSRDDMPLIGRAPGMRRVWMNTGHGMMGVGMSCGSAQLLADLMAGRAPAIDPAPYRPERFL
jgi:D-amino-acid dehydrogenase